MGYETTLVVVNTYGKKTGYRSVMASVELHKCCNDTKLGELVERLTNEVEDRKVLVKEVENLHEKLYPSDTTDLTKAVPLTGKDRKKLLPKYSRLEEKLPHMYWTSGNKSDVEDSYGTPLMEADVDEVVKALEYDAAKTLVEEDYNYHPYGMALGLLKSMSEDYKKRAKVVLFGH